MAFVKVDCERELQKEVEKNPDIVKYVEEFNREYELIQTLVKARKESGFTQKDIAMKSGLTQQMVSRIEKIDNSPTLANLMKYITAIGAVISIQKI